MTLKDHNKLYASKAWK